MKSVQWLRMCIAAHRVFYPRTENRTPRKVFIYFYFCRFVERCAAFFSFMWLSTQPLRSFQRKFILDAHQHGRTHSTHTCGRIGNRGDAFMIMPQLSEPIHHFERVRSMKYNHKIFHKCTCIASYAQRTRTGPNHTV